MKPPSIFFGTVHLDENGISQHHFTRDTVRVYHTTATGETVLEIRIQDRRATLQLDADACTHLAALLTNRPEAV